MKKFVFMAVLTVTFVAGAQAQAMEGLSIGVDGFGGYTSSTVPTGASKPTVLAFGGGVSAGMDLGPLTAGVTSDFMFYNQYSEPDAVVGNLRGTRWNIAAPFVAMKLGDFTLRANGQFLGNYKLTTLTADGATLSYTKPLGGRADVLYPVGHKIHAGAYFEYVTFSKQSSTTAGETDLTTKWKLIQFGLTATFAVM